MKKLLIPRTQLTVSRIAYGCAMLGYDWNSSNFVEGAVAQISAALEQGISFIDTADVYGYGKAELALGKLLKHSASLRQQIVVQSKCGDCQYFSGSPGTVDCSYDNIVSSVESSLRRLNTDYLDILLLHWPDNLVQPDEVARAFDCLYSLGKVRYFGVSNHNPHQIELLQKFLRQPIVTNQIQIGLAHWFVTTEPIKGALTHGYEGAATLDYCRAHDIHVQAYSPLRADYSGELPNLLRPTKDAGPEVCRAIEQLSDIAAEHSASPSAIMLAWVLHHPAQMVAVIGCTRVEHLIDNCAADRVEISRAEWYALLWAVSQVAG